MGWSFDQPIFYAGYLPYGNNNTIITKNRSTHFTFRIFAPGYAAHKGNTKRQYQ